MACLEEPQRLRIEVQPALKIQGPPDAYKNQSHPRGALFISNCRHFDDRVKYKKRLGSDHDVNNVKHLFTEMGYDCISIVEDLTREELLRELNSFKDHSIHRHVDSLVAVFMSHGEEGRLLTRNGEYIEVEEIYNKFDNISCPMLQDKPKVFLFQHCRGTIETAIPDLDFDLDGRTLTPKPRNYPKPGISDAFLCFSTRKGFVSYRDPRKGGVFIENVCKVFMEKAKDKRLIDLIAEVNSKLSKSYCQQGCEIQFINHHYPFYFNPCVAQWRPPSRILEACQWPPTSCVIKASQCRPPSCILEGGQWRPPSRILEAGQWRPHSCILEGGQWRPPSRILESGQCESSVVSSKFQMEYLSAGWGKEMDFESWIKAINLTIPHRLSYSAEGRTLFQQCSESPPVPASPSPTSQHSTHGALKRKTKLKNYVFILSYLLGCEEDIRILELKFTQMDFKVIIVPPVQTLEALKKSIRSNGIRRKSMMIVFFFGEGYENYLYLGKDSTESVSFKAFTEAFKATRLRKCSTIVFTNTCFKYKSSTTILRTSPQPSWNAFHVCVKVNGKCSKGSVFTRALLQELELDRSKEEFVDFACRVKRRVDDLSANDDDQYIVDIRYYGVYKPCQFPHHLKLG